MSFQADILRVVKEQCDLDQIFTKAEISELLAEHVDEEWIKEWVHDNGTTVFDIFDVEDVKSALSEEPINDYFDKSDIQEWCKEHCLPEHVFDVEQLRSWAEQNYTPPVDADLEVLTMIREACDMIAAAEKQLAVAKQHLSTIKIKVPA